MISVNRQADIAYKSLKGLASTSTLRAYYEETHPYLQRILLEQIWTSAELIPAEAPEISSGVVDVVTDLVLTQEPGKENAWYSADLIDAIDPERFGDSYVYTLKDGLGNVIPAGSGNYEVNPDAGVVTFDDDVVQANVPISISFWRYSGPKGISTEEDTLPATWVDDASVLRSVTTHTNGFTIGVFDTNRVYKYVSSSTLTDDGEDVIKPDDVSESGRWISQISIPSDSATMPLGAAPDSKSWSDGYVNVTESSLQNVFNYEVSKVLKLMVPVAPSTLDGQTITVTTYIAKQAGTGTEHDCTEATQPIGTLESVSDAESGDLYVEVDTVEDGRITLTDGDDSGTDGALEITSNYDPYAGQSGKEGFYKVLDLSVQATSALSVGQHTYRFRHTIDGGSVLKELWVDDPITSSISSVSITVPTATTRYVSGVPSLVAGQTFSIDFTVDNAVKSHYNASKLAQISGSTIQGVSVAPPETPPAEDSSPAYTGEEVLSASGYSENVTISIVPYNSKDVAGTQSDNQTGCRIDTISDESARLRVGSGQYPSTGYGDAYDVSISLKDTGYTEELQMLNGKYQIPTGDYSSVVPTAGPDYSTGMGTGWRYCIPLASFAISATSGFTLTFQGGSGLSINDLDTDNIRVQIKVEGVTGWLDANSAFSLVGAPESDGDACMVYSESNASVRRVSFGNEPRTGQVYVRLGLPYDSAKQFSGVTISDIV